MTRFRVILVLSLAMAAAGTAWFVVGRRLIGRHAPNVILISIDTCRADHLSSYGYPSGTTPHIDALAREGILFENTVSPVPLTLPAHCSLLTGTIPPYHGVHDNLDYRLGDSSVTLAELLRKHGYRTGAVIGAFVLDSQTGIAQGFDTFDDRLTAGGASAGNRPERRAEEVSRIACAWLAERAPTLFFLFVHFYDPHDPYTPPEPFASRFSGDPYAGEIAYTDQAIGRIIEKLKQLDLYDSSIIIIVGDHGESLSEHGESTHGYFIYHSTTKVPLVVKLPGRRESRRVKETVSLVDIMPTILAQLGLPSPRDLQGQDLFPALSSDAVERKQRSIYTESMLATKYGCGSLFGLENTEWKYIQSSTPELYNLTLDPGEQHNVIDQHPEQARSLQRRLKSLLARHHRRDHDESALVMDAESLARLRALGYTGGTVEETFEFDTTKEDPKDFIEIHTQLERMDRLAYDKDYANARQIGQGILAIRPDSVQVHQRLGIIAVEEGDTDAGITHYSEALRLAPNFPDAPLWHNNLGILVARKGRFDEAVKHFHEALRLVQPDGGIPNEGGRARKARRGSKSLVVSARLNLGDVRLRQGRLTEGVDEFRRAVSVDPDNAAAHYKLSEALSQVGRTDEASVEYRKAVQLQQDKPATLRALDAASSAETTPNKP